MTHTRGAPQAASGGRPRRLRWILAGACLAAYVASMAGLLFWGREDPLRPLTDLRITAAAFGLSCGASLVAAAIYASRRRARRDADEGPPA